MVGHLLLGFGANSSAFSCSFLASWCQTATHPDPSAKAFAFLTYDCQSVHQRVCEGFALFSPTKDVLRMLSKRKLERLAPTGWPRQQALTPPANVSNALHVKPLHQKGVTEPLASDNSHSGELVRINMYCLPWEKLCAYLEKQLNCDLSSHRTHYVSPLPASNLCQPPVFTFSPNLPAFPS